MGDSALIIDRLVEQGRMARLDEGLSPHEAATDLRIRSMLEDRIYFLVVSYRP